MKQNKDGYRPNETGVYIYGQRAVIIDGCAEIYEYSETSVVFFLGRKSKYLKIYGSSLSVRVAGQNVSEVTGHVDGVKFGDKNA